MGVDAAAQGVEDAKTAISQANQQLALVQNSSEGGSSEYYAAMRESVNANIAGLDNQISKSYVADQQKYYASLIEGGRHSIAALEKQIADSTITAPISGIVTDLYIKDANAVQPFAPIAKISSLAENRVEVYVSTNDIDEVKVGAEVELALKRRDEDKVFTGRVIEIENRAVEKISSLGAVEKRVKVNISPDDAESFHVGYDVDVRFIFYKENNKLTVPKTAVFSNGDLDYVFVVAADGKLETREIHKGRELRTEFVVENGVAVGDFVLTSADESGIREGVRVAPVYTE